MRWSGSIRGRVCIVVPSCTDSVFWGFFIGPQLVDGNMADSGCSEGNGMLHDTTPHIGGGQRDATTDDDAMRAAAVSIDLNTSPIIVWVPSGRLRLDGALPSAAGRPIVIDASLCSLLTSTQPARWVLDITQWMPFMQRMRQRQTQRH